VDAKNPADAQAQQRSQLDSRRVAAVQRFMDDYNAGRVPPVNFRVEVMDLADPSIQAFPIVGSDRMITTRGTYQRLLNNYQGVLPNTSAFGVSSGSSGGGGAP